MKYWLDYSINISYHPRNSSDPKKRFQLFLKATQMDVIIEKLDACSHQNVKAKAQLELQMKVSESLKEAKEKAERKYLQFESVERFKVSKKVYLSEEKKCLKSIFYSILITGGSSEIEMRATMDRCN